MEAAQAMNWRRSIVAIGAGVLVGWFLCGYSAGAWWGAFECDGSPGEGMCAEPSPSGLGGLARLAAAPFVDRPEFDTLVAVGVIIGCLASVVVAGFVTSLLAPRRRLSHAVVVGPLLWSMSSVHDFHADNLLHALAWALPAALGGVVGWTIVGLRARPKAHVPDEQTPVAGSLAP